ncbi:hypothetical protein E2F43_13565 [Seongchinamella unica]|uniref:Uncharacterized protein n=1 Tax=Seongchinamella unica TaxID=2547392 RepID=A0A4V2ZX12_9GAMM|nr:hypothetical protein [Seongchinamella unica]TDG12613.1 hypothetical protein E2F43_13565 [Seongchinamella unica]
MHYWLTLTLIIPGFLYGADDSDAVNERIPVSATQLEAHWGIDCPASWLALAAGDCPPPPALSRVLQLCAAIHQPPGEPGAANCPDYQAATAAATRSDCPQLQHIIRASGECLALPDQADSASARETGFAAETPWH